MWLKLCRPFLAVYPKVTVCLCPQQPKDICVHAGFCTAMKKSIPMMLLQAAKTVPAAKAVPALKLFPATKVESATDKSAKVSHGGHLSAPSHQYSTLIQDKKNSFTAQYCTCT